MPLSKAHSLNIVFGTDPNNIGKEERRRFGGRLFRKKLSSSSSRVHNGASVLYSTRSTGKVSFYCNDWPCLQDLASCKSIRIENL